MQNIEYYKKDQFLPGNIGNFIYGTRGCQLTINSLNYRCPEFEQVDWNKSVVVFGCSNVFGVNLNDADTICAQLEKIIDRPVINMGVPASSISYSVFNQVILAEKNYNPYAVINIWTSPNRLTLFSPNYPYHAGPWTDRLSNKNINARALISIFHAWNIKESNPSLYSLLLQRFAKLMWKDTQHIEGTFFPNTHETLDVELFHYIDKALDNQHPGPNTAKAVALRLAEQLK
jgi:hypothetical protein